MFYLILSAAVILFIAHVGLLITAFPGFKLARRRYFYSHLTLWFTGLLVFVLALLYSGSERSAFLDYFDSPFKKAMILVFTIALSFVAHLIVKLLVLLLMQKQQA